MRKAMLVLNPKTLTPELKNVFVEVEKEEIKKGMRPFEKSSDKIKRKRIFKVYNRWNDTNTNRKGSLTPYQYFNIHTSLGEYGKNPAYSV
mgnify:FL=1|tara:strand:+ start:303 stop:572 length:270 start_codon:yes stop_codon:yes gene_type:complete